MSSSSRPIRFAVIALAVLACVAAALALAQGSDEPDFDPGQAHGRGFAADAEGEFAVVWTVGDGADGGEAASELAELISSSAADRFLYLGDVYDDGTAQEYVYNYAAVYGKLDAITSPTPGNHEWDNRAEGYDVYWAGHAGGRAPYYYAFRLAGWELISLNSASDFDSGSDQLEWLSDELSEDGTCRLAFWHVPRFAAGKYGDDATLQPFWDELEGRASLVVNGHDHNYQRFEPVDGITQIIAGAGGHELYPVDENPRLAASNDEDYGAVRLELSQGEASYEYLDAEESVLDEGTVRCEPLTGG